MVTTPVFSVPATTPQGNKPMPGADVLRHIHRANVSYLAPVGNGLTLTAGLLNSFIGYESFYSRNNYNYTRSYMADNAPYFMTGVAAQYAVDQTLTFAVYVINGYEKPVATEPGSELRHSSDVEASAPVDAHTEYIWSGSIRYRADVLAVFLDSIVEWKDANWTVAFAYDIGTENAVEQAGHPRLLWSSTALFARYHISGPLERGSPPRVVLGIETGD